MCRWAKGICNVCPLEYIRGTESRFFDGFFVVVGLHGQFGYIILLHETESILVVGLTVFSSPQPINPNSQTTCKQKEAASAANHPTLSTASQP